MDDACRALVSAPDRIGWRGNSDAWIRRGREYLAATPPAAHQDVIALAQVVDAWQLMRPAVACHVPLREWGVFSAVWRDAQHVVLSINRPPLTAEQLDIWLGCLAYVMRHRPRIGPADASRLRPPPGALARAMQDACWAPAAGGCTRTRTVMALAFADRSASPALTRAAVEWVTQTRPANHRTAALDALLAEAHAMAQEDAAE